MKELKLNWYDITILVDDEDYDRLSKFNWYVDTENGIVKGLHRVISKGSKKDRVVINISFANEVMNDYSFQLYDHKDRNPLNNQKYNLRPCTHSQNIINQPKRKYTSSKYRGVYAKTNTNKWCASIQLHGKVTHLGTFVSEIEAALAYNKAAKELHGDFAQLNTISYV